MSRWTNHGSIAEEKSWAEKDVKCSWCGLTGSDMVGTPPRCALQARCDQMLKHESFGGPIWTGPMNRVELDADDVAAIDAAVKRWKARKARAAAA